MKKILFTFFLTTVLVSCAILCTAGYLAGDYLVGFALERGSFGDPQGPPHAYALLMPPDKRQFNPPDAPSEEWHLKSTDGLFLNATHFWPDEESSRWVMILHGYGCTQQNSWFIAETYLQMGYHVLTPDLRASGKSEGSYVTMGYRESQDIVDWAWRITELHPDAQIVMHGVSMGAASVMIAAASRGLPPTMKAAIEDCGYSSAYTILAHQLEAAFGLPAFPIMAFVDFACKKRAGFSLREANPLKAVQEARVPMLFIHGDADTLVPPTMCWELYENCHASRKDYFSVPNAGHAVACQKYPDLYYQKIFGFLKPLMQ